MRSDEVGDTGPASEQRQRLTCYPRRDVSSSKLLWIAWFDRIFHMTSINDDASV